MPRVEICKNASWFRFNFSSGGERTKKVSIFWFELLTETLAAWFPALEGQEDFFDSLGKMNLYNLFVYDNSQWLVGPSGFKITLLPRGQVKSQHSWVNIYIFKLKKKI
jgi:hypothetical protein